MAERDVEDAPEVPGIETLTVTGVPLCALLAVAADPPLVETGTVEVPPPPPEQAAKTAEKANASPLQ